MADEQELSGGELLAKISYPSYAVRLLSGQHLLVAGGGGAAKTGVANGFQIFELKHNGKQTEAEEVAWYETADCAIMNCTTFSTGRFDVLAAGLDGDLQLYAIKKKVVEEGEEGHVLKSEDKFVAVRRRRKSESESRARGESFSNTLPPTPSPPLTPTSDKIPKRPPKKRIAFDIEIQELVRTDFCTDDDGSFQKVVRVSRDRSFFVTGGCDGHIRLWSYPGLKRVHEIKAHNKEVDDTDISPDGCRIVSIGKDNKAFVWNVKDGKKVAQVDFDLPTNGCKYIFKKCRFATVEGNVKNYCLFTVHNPVGNSNRPSYIVKWNTNTYIKDRSATELGSLSAIAVNDDGRYLAVGSMDTGAVTIYISYNLQQLKTVPHAHNMFVTGLEFLPSSDASRAVTGGSDASVVSVSVDNQIKIHHIPRRKTMTIFSAAILIIVVMFITFVVCSMLGL